MAIQQFNPVYRPIVTPINLEKIGAAYDTLEQGHQQTMAQASAVKQELAKLDLNEAEDAWRQQQINKIESTITDNSQYGNAYSAFDDVIAKAGSIMSNPGMIGRLRAQQDYKTYLAELDKAAISDEYKEYYKEVNKYNYSDKYDDKGNVIGGTKWTPSEKEVDTIPMTAILNQALQWAAKESGGSNQTRWLDKDGKITTDITKSVTGEIYSNTTNSWQRLSKEKLAAAVNVVIENTPGAKASLEQDYKIAKWKYDKNGYNPDIVDKNGIVLTPEEYLNKRIDPFYNAATYYNQNSTTQYGNAWKAQLELTRKQKAAAAANQNYTNGFDSIITHSNPIVTNNDFPIEAQATIISSKQELANLIKATNPEANFNLDGKTKDELLEYVKQIKPENQAQAIGLINDILDNEEYLTQLKEQMSPEDTVKFDAYNAIISMGDLKDDDYDIKRNYSNLLNDIFGNNKAIRQYFVDDDSVNEFIDQLGGVDILSDLGIKRGVDENGKKYFELDRTNIKSLYSFAKAAKNAYKNTHNFFGRIWSHAKNEINSYAGDNFMVIDNNGEEHVYLRSRFLIDGTNQPSSVFSNLINFVDNLKSTSDRVLKGGKLVRSTEFIPASTPNVAELQMKLQNGEIEPSYYNANKEIEDNSVINSLRGIDFSQYKVYMVGEDGIFQNEVNSSERKKLNGKFVNSKNEDISIGTTLSDGTNTPSPLITIKGENDELTRFIVVGGFDSKIIQSWKENTSFLATNDINKYAAADRKLSVSDNYGFAGIDNLQLIPIGNKTWQLINKENNTIIGQVNNQTAKDIRTNYLDWKQTYDYVKAGLIPANSHSVIAMIDKTAKYYTSLVGGDNDLYAYYVSKLTKNLINQ